MLAGIPQCWCMKLLVAKSLWLYWMRAPGLATTSEGSRQPLGSGCPSLPPLAPGRAANSLLVQGGDQCLEPGLSKDGYSFGVAGFLSVLLLPPTVAHPWIAAEEPTVEFCI